MFRRTISANDHTDVDAEIAALRAACSNARIDSPLLDMMIAQVGDVLNQLVARGNQLAEIGSQMQVTREIAGSGYSIKVIFSTNAKRTLIQRLWSALRGR
jgi:hypothetical protein